MGVVQALRYRSTAPRRCGSHAFTNKALVSRRVISLDEECAYVRITLRSTHHQWFDLGVAQMAAMHSVEIRARVLKTQIVPDNEISHASGMLVDYF